jgi:hypothetical protein
MKRDPNMHQTRKGNQRHFCTKAHISVDADSGLMHKVATTTANGHDITQAHALLHRQGADVFADSAYRGPEKRKGIQNDDHQPNWHVARMPGKRKTLNKGRKAAGSPICWKGSKRASAPRWSPCFGSSSASLVLSRSSTKPGRKIGQPDDLVCAEQPVNGTRGLDEVHGRAGISASEIIGKTPKRDEKRAILGPQKPKRWRKRYLDSIRRYLGRRRRRRNEF